MEGNLHLHSELRECGKGVMVLPQIPTVEI